MENSDGGCVDGHCFAWRDRSFLYYFIYLPDLRQAGKVIYPLHEVLLLALLAVLAGAGSFTGIARFGEKKLAQMWVNEKLNEIAAIPALPGWMAIERAGERPMLGAGTKLLSGFSISSQIVV